MSRAFDQVPRQLVEQAILDAGYTEATTTAMLVWLQPSTYGINHKGLRAEVPCAKGRQQGPRSGPLEWNLVTRYVFQKLLSQKGLAWIQQHITNFADDFHVCGSGCDECSLHRAVREAAEILSLLEGFGFQLNMQKSVVLLKVTGKKAQSFSNNTLSGARMECF